jgi:carotenoid cleavage dioxygenase
MATAYPYRSSGFAPVSSETSIAALEVEGEVPAGLVGTYHRKGPIPIGTVQPGDEPMTGDGMVHAVTLLAGGRAAYRNRWVRTAAAAARLGVEPPAGPPQMAHDRSNCAIVDFDGRILSISGGALPYELTPNLDTIARTDLGGAVRDGMSGHVRPDLPAGELHVLTARWEPPLLHHVVLRGGGRASTSRPLPLSPESQMHDFALTPNWLVVFDQPAPVGMAASAVPFAPRPERGARVGLLGRREATARWFDTETCYVTHTVNAFETEGAVVVDVCAADAPSAPARLERWTIGQGDQVGRRVLDDDAQDFPRINELFTGAPYRHAYTVRMRADGRTPAGALLQHDAVSGKVRTHEFGDGGLPGEFVFVADAGRAAQEDGGWVVGLVHDSATRSARLAVIDAQHFDGPPVATVHIPTRIPLGLHGAWIAGR